MTRSPSVAAAEHSRETAAVADSSSSRWLIGFARFVPYPYASSSLPLLVPLTEKIRHRSPRGTWMSASPASATVSFRISADASISDAILAVELDGKVLEEHYTSKLNFSWPQMSCVAGFPPRGSRAIFVSYKDSANEIQKFALRFATCDAAETFVETLKEKVKGLGEVAGTQKSDYKSEISFESDRMSSNKIIPRESKEDPEIVIPLDSYIPEMPPRIEYEVEQQVGLSHIPNKASTALPPSFTTLLSECFSQANQDPTTVKENSDLKLQIMRYMEDSSFQDMLLKVDKIIDEIGGNWIF
ncbi:PREDICTED: protein POOR HOMOLOGOUS SYNAPSIS 1 isoform X2 [Tarenaya hassleriana]|uniref:protein POOR HOMOLOGOUS SYNAPSIS 1 isoform X2 n=1 Tax=Tarenaya hassleriana TaxID=28532 RepID=UPI0008FD2F48|nr:PREDICTED: protein POOR HOMOLOGOUS SYNAPSIS 1 isoform X2 [Tarenaya hassleriana]